MQDVKITPFQRKIMIAFYKYYEEGKMLHKPHGFVGMVANPDVHKHKASRGILSVNTIRAARALAKAGLVVVLDAADRWSDYTICATQKGAAWYQANQDKPTNK